MKKSLLLLSVLACAAGARAQQPENTLSVSGGAAFPLGAFASRRITLPLKGVARTGGSGEISWQHLYPSGWGAALSLTGWYNPIDTRSLERQFRARGISDPITGSSPGPVDPSSDDHTGIPNAVFSDAR